MKNVTGYEGFSSVVEEQSGHYLGIKVDTDPLADEVTVEVVGGTKGPVVLDEDRMIVLRIKDESITTIRVKATKGGISQVEDFDISELVLEA